MEHDAGHFFRLKTPKLREFDMAKLGEQEYHDFLCATWRLRVQSYTTLRARGRGRSKDTRYERGRKVINLAWLGTATVCSSERSRDLIKSLPFSIFLRPPPSPVLSDAHSYSRPSFAAS